MFRAKDEFFSKTALILFLLCLPLSLRKVVWSIDPSGNGVFNEYTDISVYLSDLAVGVVFIAIILEHKEYLLSISWWKKLFHVEQFTVLFLAPLPFLLWSGLSILWSKSEILALTSLFRLLEGYFVYLAFIFLIVPRGTFLIRKALSVKDDCSTWNNSGGNDKRGKMFHVEQLLSKSDQLAVSEENVPRGTFARFFSACKKKCSTWNNLRIVFLAMAFGGFLEAIIAIIQFVWQHSLGLTFLQESQFTVHGSGIAKILFGSITIIRPYGLFPHPNVLAGYLGITLIITAFYPLIFGRGLFHVEQCRLVYRIVMGVQIIGFLLTFSKSALIGLLFALTYAIYQLFHVEQVVTLGNSMWDKSKHLEKIDKFGRASFYGNKCSTWNNRCVLYKRIKKMFHVEQFVNLGSFIKDKGALMKTNQSNEGDFKVRKCSTWNSWSIFYKSVQKMFHVEQLWNLTWPLVSGYVVYSFIRAINWHYYLIQPLNERLFAYHEAVLVFLRSPFQGIGIGQSVLVMQDFFPEKLEIWQFQPIHNIYLLAFSETGAVGFLLYFSYFLYLWFRLSPKIVPRGTIIDKISQTDINCSTWNNPRGESGETKMFHVEQSLLVKKDFEGKYVYVPRGTFKKERIATLFSTLLLFVAVVSLFDHYFWDIQQGQLLLWMMAGLAAVVDTVATPSV